MTYNLGQSVIWETTPRFSVMMETFFLSAQKVVGSGQADAAAKAGDKGGAYSGAVEVAPGVWVYQITKNGLALQLTLQGTKYYMTTTSTKNHSS
jgi:hypothetical protein